MLPRNFHFKQMTMIGIRIGISRPALPSFPLLPGGPMTAHYSKIELQWIWKWECSHGPCIRFIVEHDRGKCHRPEHPNIPHILPILLHSLLTRRWRLFVYKPVSHKVDRIHQNLHFLSEKPAGRLVVMWCLMRCKAFPLQARRTDAKSSR